MIGRPHAGPEKLRTTWDAFIHTHHYKTHDNYFDSWIANHPRRSTEAWFSQNIEAKFIDVNPVPRDLDLEATIDWYRELISHEKER